MTDIKDVPNNLTRLYKNTVYKNRSLVIHVLRDINEQVVINSLDSSLRFYINHIVKE